MFIYPSLMNNFIFLRETKEEYIHHYYNWLSFASFDLHFYQFASAYTLLVSSFHSHSHIFADAFTLLVSSPYFLYHQVADVLMIVTNWKNSWLLEIWRYYQN